jgi:hypothetical protein
LAPSARGDMERIIQYLESPKTEEAIAQLIQDNILLYQGIDTNDKIQSFSGLIYNQFVAECVQDNQYVSLSKDTTEKINIIYKDLILKLRSLKSPSFEKIKQIVHGHRNKITIALRENVYEETIKQLHIPCSEYSGELQKEVLRIDTVRLREPIIDIGCGHKAELVQALRRNNYESVYGLDQYTSADTKIICCNWFEYTFLQNTWGTVIAHMSFSNHLKRVLLFGEDTKELYMKKYYEILNSLKPGGMFIYTPSVKSIEEKLGGNTWTVRYYQNMHDRSLDTVHITRNL